MKRGDYQLNRDRCLIGIKNLIPLFVLAYLYKSTIRCKLRLVLITSVWIEKAEEKYSYPIPNFKFEDKIYRIVLFNLLKTFLKETR